MNGKMQALIIIILFLTEDSSCSLITRAIPTVAEKIKKDIILISQVSLDNDEHLTPLIEAQSTLKLIHPQVEH